MHLRPRGHERPRKLTRLRHRFGAPGVIAVIALVLAMAGGALAASGALSGKQKKEVEKIAKKFQGAGPAGPAGLAGPAGPGGGKGATGSKGANGNDGAKGATGSPWVPDRTLPEGATETGAWSFGPLPTGTLTSSATGGVSVPISFPVPLAAELPVANVHYVTKAQQIAGTVPAECSVGATKGSASAPLAESGNLCVFEGALGFANPIANNIRKVGPAEFGASTAGAYLLFEVEEESTGRGSFAVTG